MNDSRSFQLPGRAVALVLAGGRGSRLHELTDRRAKPAVYFGGKFRIIDFAAQEAPATLQMAQQAVRLVLGDNPDTADA